MKALLLAGGLGSRLKPLTDTTPKCLVPIGGSPLLGYWIDSLIDAGVTDIFINLHYLGSAVQKFVEAGNFDCRIHFLEETELLGTGGTLKKNASLFQDGDFILAHADNFCLADLKDFFTAHKDGPDHIKITMMTFSTDNPKACGIVELDNDNIVTHFHEKVLNPPSNIANGAVFVIKPEVLETLCKLNDEVIDFSRDVIPLFTGKIIAWKNDVYHRDIGSIQDYNKANSDWAQICDGQGNK